MSVDVSVLMSVRGEVKYLRRTLASLEEAARRARGAGVRVGLAVALDRPSRASRAWMADYDASAFDAFCTREPGSGSRLGCLREAALAATGEYVLLCAAGEMVSRTLLERMHAQAAALGPETILTPQYSLHVGDAPHLARYFASGPVPAASLLARNPFPETLFLRRTLFLELCSHGLTEPEEDRAASWRFNCDAVALGLGFQPVPGTVVFTRDPETCLARSESGREAGLPGRSILFDPATFLARCREGADPDAQALESGDIIAEFLNEPGMVELLHAANALDPSVHMEMFEYCRATHNLERDPALGRAYAVLCEAAGGEPFTDVFLMPFLTRGGADKVILSVIEGLGVLAPGGRILMACGESFERHAWLDRLPDSVVFLDLPRLLPGVAAKDLDTVCLRLVQALGRGARLHLKASHFAHRFFRRFGAALPGNFVLAYRFSDYVYQSHGLRFVNGYFFNFISDNLERLDRIVTDNQAVVALDAGRMGCDQGRWQTLDVKCAPLTTPERIRARGRSFARRLLWASRLDREKRLEVLELLGEKLAGTDLGVTIDVYGGPVLDEYSPERLEACGALRYKGPFDSFESLDPQSYDGFVYTTAFDGMPNVILEALSAGLPVIAPDVGGISRAVQDGITGSLLPDLTDDEAMAAAYVAAIRTLYADAQAHERMRLAALEFILTRHGEARFNARLAEILGVGA